MASLIDAGGGGVLEGRGQQAEQILPRVRRGELDEQVPGRILIQGIGDARHVLHGQFHRQARHQLERGHLIAGRGAQARQQIQGMLRRVDAGQRRRRVGRLREEFQARRGNDAERAFGAHEQGFHIVAGVVLAQALQPLEHPAVREHHFEAQHQVAHHAVAQYRGASRHWSTDYRRSAPCPRSPNSAGRGGPLRGRPPAPRPACSPPRRSSNSWRRRPAARDSAGAATARSATPASSGVAPPQ